ncbi:MAG: methylenetetrahydrofolate--tRNA-(uracil(54)-C(5))-methyltransferase (FADH(2)-oxidizing) TrmFO [Bacillota bacterium]|nr:methylenetetrahydrofolate--tRNA-(uracil(54)-C(5))-methyltransferase (FADH(2)-oxidizing) TrmFO [Bacillota bacterium]
MIVVGAGLAGCEAAYQLAERDIKVRLYEMKPDRFSGAHHYNSLAELVCSNSLKGNSVDNACGLLKEEMRRFNSLIIKCADETKVPAGGALAVDREKFSNLVTEKIEAHKNISLIREEIFKIPENEPVIIATGPLTDNELFEDIKRITGGNSLFFYDAAAPLVSFESIDMSKAFFGSRYNKGTPDYINCPMNYSEYEEFYEALINAELAPLKEEIEKPEVFEGCMPVEVMAKRGKDTLLFGPLKPVGLEDFETGERYHAVVQLRKDNTEGTIYNMVGFQTNLKFGEQKRVFSMIPALKNAEYLRYGVMHRNSFINSPALLSPDYSLRDRKEIFFAGQITGVEGYVESAASGMLAGINAANRQKGEEPFILPDSTMLGALTKYITTADEKHFQPMNANFGIISAPKLKIRNKRERYTQIALNSLSVIDNFTKF